MSEQPVDFVWCEVRDDDNGHECANNRPGHTEHRCCCGTVIPPARTAPTTADVRAGLEATRKADQEARDRRAFGGGGK